MKKILLLLLIPTICPGASITNVTVGDPGTAAGTRYPDAIRILNTNDTLLNAAITAATLWGTNATTGGITNVGTADVIASGRFIGNGIGLTNIPESGVTSLVTDLAAKAPTARTISTTAPLTGGGDLSANRTLAMAAATDSVDGYLTAADHTTFNGKVAATRTLTIAGTANQVTSSAGAQDLSADRTWTMSLPSTLNIPGTVTVSNTVTLAKTINAAGSTNVTGIAGDGITSTNAQTGISITSSNGVIAITNVPSSTYISVEPGTIRANGQLNFNHGGTLGFSLAAGSIFPNADSGQTIGFAARRFAGLFLVGGVTNSLAANGSGINFGTATLSTYANGARGTIPGAETTLTESSPTAILTCVLANSKYAGFSVFATTHANDASDFQSRVDKFHVAAVNKAGTVTLAISTIGTADTAAALSTGTLATTWTATASGTTISIKNSAVSSLTQTTLACKWRVEVDTDDTALAISPQ